MEIQDLKIGQQVKFDRGIGEIASLNSMEYQDWSYGDDYCITVKQGGAFYSCTIEEIQNHNN